MLYDGGSATAGDETAGDGTYTNNSLHANEGMPSGPRTVRIKAEVQDTEGYRWAIAVDFEPFSVDGVAPAGDTATIEATPPDASDEPTDSAGGPPASDQGDDAAQGSGDWSEWEGAPEPEECTAPAPTADELIKTLIAAAAEPPDTSVIPAQVDTEAEVPAGEPVDEETAAVALDTLHQLAACTNAGHPAFFGLFTPNGIASLFVYFGLPLQPLTEEAIQDLEENIGTALAEPPTPVAEGERSGITEIRDVRLLEDGRVLVLVLADFPNGELLGYLVLVEEDDRWLIDALGIVGEPIEIELGF
jgi:hypothetical protein